MDALRAIWTILRMALLIGAFAAPALADCDPGSGWTPGKPCQPAANVGVRSGGVDKPLQTALDDGTIARGLVARTVNSAVTLAVNDLAQTNTTSAPFTVTLPAAPVDGSVIEVQDVGGTWDTNNLTVARGGSDTIEGATTKVLSKEYGAARFVYDSTTARWNGFEEATAGAGVADGDKSEVTVSGGGTVWTLDAYAQTALELANGITPSNRLYPPGDIRRYGAVAGGAAGPNTTAIQAALDSGHETFVPNGTFSISATLLFTTGDRIRFESRNAILLANLGGALLAGRDAATTRLYDVQIESGHIENVRATAGGIGIDFNNVTQGKVFGTWITLVETGVRQTAPVGGAAYYNEFHGVDITAVAEGYQNGSRANDNKVFGGRVNDCTVAGTTDNDNSGNTYYSLSVEVCPIHHRNSNTAGSSFTRYIGSRTENTPTSGTGYSIGAAAQDTFIEHPYFQGLTTDISDSGLRTQIVGDRSKMKLQASGSGTIVATSAPASGITGDIGLGSQTSGPYAASASEAGDATAALKLKGPTAADGEYPNNSTANCAYYETDGDGVQEAGEHCISRNEVWTTEFIAGDPTRFGVQGAIDSVCTDVTGDANAVRGGIINVPNMAVDFSTANITVPANCWVRIRGQGFDYHAGGTGSAGGTIWKVDLSGDGRFFVVTAPNQHLEVSGLVIVHRNMPSGGSVIECPANACDHSVFEDNEIVPSGSAATVGDGIHITDAVNPMVRRNRIEGMLNPIHFDGTEGNGALKVYDNVLRPVNGGTVGNGILIDGTYPCTDVRAVGNVLESGNTGLNASSGTKCTIEFANYTENGQGTTPTQVRVASAAVVNVTGGLLNNTSGALSFHRTSVTGSDLVDSFAGVDLRGTIQMDAGRCRVSSLSANVGGAAAIAACEVSRPKREITVTGTATAIEGGYYLANTTGGAFTITLPTPNKDGDEVCFADSHGTWDTNNLTIARGGSDTIEGGTSVALATEYGVACFRHNFDNAKWIAFAEGGAGGGSGDNVQINGVAAVDPDFRNEGDNSFIRCTAAGVPDASCVAAEDVISRVQANSVALGTDTTGLLPLAEGGTATDTSAYGGAVFCLLSGSFADCDTWAELASAFGITGTALDASGNATFRTLVTADLDGTNYFDLFDNATGTPSCSALIAAGKAGLLDSDATAARAWDFCDGTSLYWRFPAPSTTTTQALFATATSGAAAFRALATGDLPSGATLDTEWDTIAEIETAIGSLNVVLATEIDTSAEIAAIVGDETGTGGLVLATGPTLTDVSLAGTVTSTATAGTGMRHFTHATDCTGLTTGALGDTCWEQDANAVYTCEPTAGGCDTAGEWILASGAGGGDDVSVNSSAVVGANFNDFSPAAPAGAAQVSFSATGSGPAAIGANVPTSAIIAALRRKPMVYAEFFGTGNSSADTAGAWDVDVLSSGTAPGTTGTAHHPGVQSIVSSTTTNSGARFRTTGVDNVLLAGGEVFEIIFQHKVASGTATLLRMGFLDTGSNTAPVDGAWIGIAEGSLAATCNTSSNSTLTTSATIATLTVDTWYRARITVNSDATSVTCEIWNDSGTSQGSQANTTNIPTAAGREVGHGIIATNSGTTATTLVWVDWLAFFYDARALTR